jgi:hypothetical protein
METSDTPDGDAGEENVSRNSPSSEAPNIASSSSSQDPMESVPQRQRKMVLDPNYPNLEIIMDVVDKLLDGFTKK